MLKQKSKYFISSTESIEHILKLFKLMDIIIGLCGQKTFEREIYKAVEIKNGVTKFEKMNLVIKDLWEAPKHDYLLWAYHFTWDRIEKLSTDSISLKKPLSKDDMIAFNTMYKILLKRLF